MKKYWVFLILSLLLACSRKEDTFKIGDDAVIGDNNQVSINLAYSSQEYFIDVSSPFDFKPTLTTHGIYDTGFEYSIFPPLPSTISFDIATGRIWGNFTQVANPGTLYFVQAKKDVYAGSTSFMLNFVPPILNPSFSKSELRFSVNQSTSYSPNANPGAVIYRITPDLPSGLILDTRTGAISGTPATVDSGVTNVNYTFYAVNNNGLERSIPLVIRRVAVLATSITNGVTLGVSGGSDIDLSPYYIGGRGDLLYQITSGTGTIHGSFITPSTNDGFVTVRATDLNGAGSSASITFHIEKPTISCIQTTVVAGNRARVRLTLNGSSYTTVNFDYTTADDPDPVFGAKNGVNYGIAAGSSFILPGSSYTEIEIQTVSVPSELNNRRLDLIVTNVTATLNTSITCDVVIQP